MSSRSALVGASHLREWLVCSQREVESGGSHDDTRSLRRDCQKRKGRSARTVEADPIERRKGPRCAARQLSRSPGWPPESPHWPSWWRCWYRLGGILELASPPGRRGKGRLSFRRVRVCFHSRNPWA